MLSAVLVRALCAFVYLRTAISAQSFIEQINCLSLLLQ